jgi:hypothetical protein
MPDVNFTFDSASAYGGMLTKQRLNVSRLIDQIGQLGLDAHELLASMHVYAGENDEEASVRGAQVAKPVAHIRDGLENVRAGLGVLRDQLKTASQAMEEADKRRANDANRLKI